MFLLEIDEPTMLARLDAPSRDNDWGRIGDTRALERRWLPGYQARMAERAEEILSAELGRWEAAV